jgi:hypothetical protein
MLDRAAEQLLESEQKAREYSLDDEAFNVGDLMRRAWAGLPERLSESEGKSSRVVNASLMCRRSRQEYWGRSRSPARGAPYFANAGLMVLIEHVARHYDYESTVIPVAAGLASFTSQLEGLEKALQERGVDADESVWRAYGRRILTTFSASIQDITFSDDPRGSLATWKESQDVARDLLAE